MSPWAFDSTWNFTKLFCELKKLSDKLWIVWPFVWMPFRFSWIRFPLLAIPSMFVWIRTWWSYKVWPWDEIVPVFESIRFCWSTNFWLLIRRFSLCSVSSLSWSPRCSAWLETSSIRWPTRIRRSVMSCACDSRILKSSVMSDSL